MYTCTFKVHLHYAGISGMSVSPGNKHQLMAGDILFQKIDYSKLLIFIPEIDQQYWFNSFRMLESSNDL